MLQPLVTDVPEHLRANAQQTAASVDQLGV